MGGVLIAARSQPGKPRFSASGGKASMKEKREIVAGAGDVINDVEESGSGPVGAPDGEGCMGPRSLCPRIWARKILSVWFLGLNMWQQMAP